MQTLANISAGQEYASAAQRVRVISETWVAENGYCLRCTSNTLDRTKANTRTQDFSCPNCAHRYELKSKRGSFGARVLDGAYSAMLRTIEEGRTPTLLLLEYTPSWSITGFTAVHHSLITRASVLPRRPLSPLARRAGWIGCSIDLTAVPPDARIPILHQGAVHPKDAARQSFARMEGLSALSAEELSWVGSVLKAIRELPAGGFSLADVYQFVPELAQRYPRNKHIKPKIRQQLQVLRDAGIVRFLPQRGHYEFL